MFKEERRLYFHSATIDKGTKEKAAATKVGDKICFLSPLL